MQWASGLYTGNQTPKEGENWGVVPIPQYDDNQQKITTSDMTAFMGVKVQREAKLLSVGSSA